MDIIVGLISLLLLIIVPIGIVFLIAFLAYQSRKKKQDIVLASLPQEAKMKFVVRYNLGKQQKEFFKLKAFQGSGVIYVLDNKIHFVDTKQIQSHTFDLHNCNIKWEGVNIANGLLNWFKIEDSAKSYFFNVESGMFIFHTKSGQLSTEQICKQLQLLQREGVTASQSNTPS